VTDLADFGGGIESVEAQDSSDDDTGGNAYGEGREYRLGRCRAISRTTGNRCRSPASDGDYCSNGSHNRGGGPLLGLGLEDTVDRVEWYIHHSENDDLDTDLIWSAVHGVVGLEHRALPVSEDGLWLPIRFARASRLIIRAPTKTVDVRRNGDDDYRRVHPTVTASAWDPDYLDGGGRTAKIRNPECIPDEGRPQVGLLIPGEEQHWFPVELPGGDDA